MNEVRSVGDLATLRITLMVEEYHKAQDQLMRFSEQRNRRYLVLVGILAQGIVLTFAPTIIELLGNYLVNELSESLRKVSPNNPDIAKEVAGVLARFNSWSVVHSLVMIVILVSVFYFMTDLLQRTRMNGLTILYLSFTESEIHRALALGEGQSPFTRHGLFYSASGGRREQLVIGVIDRVMLGCLLVLFFAFRLLFDYPEWSPPRLAETTGIPVWAMWAQRNFAFFLDVLALLLTAPMFWGYVTLRFRSEAEVRHKMADARQS